MAQQKDQNIQMVRGLCIAAVVLIHSGAAANLQSVPGQEWQFWYWLFLRQVINFAVGTFFFLSGCLVDQEKVRRAPAKFIGSRLLRLAVPFLLWSSVYSIKTVVLDWPEVYPLSLLLHFVAGKSAAPFYFILVLLQLNVLTPVLLWAQGTKAGKTIAWCITPVYLVGLGAYCILNGSQPLLYETVFPAWLIYYWAGLRWRSGARLAVRLAYPLAALAFCALNAVLLVVLLHSPALAPSQVRLATVPYALLLAMWFVGHRFPLAGKRFWKYLGDNSYGVFYIHCLALAVTGKLVNIIGGGQNVLVTQAINWAGSLCLSLLACEVLKKVLGPKRAMEWLGV